MAKKKDTIPSLPEGYTFTDTPSLPEGYSFTDVDVLEPEAVGAIIPTGPAGVQQPTEPLVTPDEINERFQTKASTTRVETQYEPQFTGDMTQLPEGAVEGVVAQPLSEEETLSFQIKSNVRDWYADRGGITPEDKIAMINSVAEDLNQQVEAGEITAEQFYDGMEAMAGNLGVKYENGEISAFPNEVKQYTELLEKEYKRHMEARAADEQDSFMKDVWDALNIGSSRVLDSFDNIMAVSEKIGNAILSPIADESTYWQDIAGHKSETLQKWSESNERYDTEILDAVKSGDMAAAVGGTVLSLMENIPQLTVLVTGNVAVLI